MDIGTFEKIVIGVIIGVSATLVSAVIKSWLAKGIFNFKRKFGKDSEDKGLYINGKWITVFSEGGQEYHENVSLDLIGNEVKGEIELIDPGDQGKITDTYRFKGVFKDRVLTATYESNDPTVYEMGAFTLNYENREFKGQYTFFSNEGGRQQIMASEYKWKRMKK